MIPEAHMTVQALDHLKCWWDDRSPEQKTDLKIVGVGTALWLLLMVGMFVGG